MMDVKDTNRRETYIMRSNSLTTVWAVGVPGTPELSGEDSQFVTSSSRTERKAKNSLMRRPLPLK